jgi:hypothetical protein
MNDVKCCTKVVTYPVSQKIFFYLMVREKTKANKSRVLRIIVKSLHLMFITT